MRSPVVRTLAALASLACSDSSAPRPAPSACPVAASAPGAALASIDEPLPLAAAGTGTVTITGGSPRDLLAGAGGYEIGPTTAFSIVDLVARDAEGAPAAELLIFLKPQASERTAPIVPVSVGDLRTSGYEPPGSFAIYAEAYDAGAEDYTRWLVARTGCIRITGVAPGLAGRITGEVSLDGDWRAADGTPLGATGSLSASFDAPLLRLATAQHLVRDTLVAAMTGARSTHDTTSTFAAFQVLAAGQRRLVMVAVVPGDTVREHWISLEGVPDADSILLSAVSTEEALSGRGAGSWAAVRFDSIGGIPLRLHEREIWRSTGGWVKLTNVVRTGPLALCGWATGRYEFPAAGVDLRAPGGADLGTALVRGTFATVFSVLPPSDTVEQGTVATAPRLASSGRLTCPR